MLSRALGKVAIQERKQKETFAAQGKPSDQKQSLIHRTRVAAELILDNLARRGEEIDKGISDNQREYLDDNVWMIGAVNGGRKSVWSYTVEENGGKDRHVLTVENGETVHFEMAAAKRVIDRMERVVLLELLARE